jgi:hypothetical protein
VWAGTLRSDLTFKPQKAVRWFAPPILLKTGQQVALSKVFAGFSDKRELQTSQPAQVLPVEGDELWVDYVCDTGDGFHATATVANVLVQPSLPIPPAGATAGSLPKGGLLVLGGDQVYPFASIEEYKDRLVGPFGAMSCQPDLPADLAHDEAEQEARWRAAPLVVAVPGNHDWYDGLTSFTRLLTRPAADSKRWPWLGGWRVEQQRSYFAVQLPQRWWLWGIDIQLDTYIDNGQLAWFKDLADEHVEEGDAIILCSAKPSWADAGPDAPEAYDNLDYFERKIIAPSGAKLRVSLTGDHHYYARYECHDDRSPGAADRQGEQKIIAGGGGAYLAATHHLQESIALPPVGSSQYDETRVRTYTRAEVDGRPAVYPSAERSKRLRWGVVSVGVMNGFGFPVLVGAVYALWAYTLFQKENRAWSWPEMALRTLLPWGSLLVLLVAGAALLGFTHERRRSKKKVARALALLHLVLHAALVVTLAWAMERAWAIWFDDGSFSMWFRLAAAVSVGVVAALLGPLVMAVYLFLADYAEVNTNELFAAQRIEDFKCFLRLHIDRNGVLTVYPIAIDRIARRWSAVERSAGESSGFNGPWLVPDHAIATRLIEPPIVVPRDPAGLS